MWNIRYFLKNISSIFREKGFLNIQRISICLRQIHISVCKRNRQIFQIYRESEVYKGWQPVSNPYSCAMFFFKCNTLKADNNNIKKQPTKKKLHKSGLFNAANLNGTFRLPYWQWTWFSAARLIWRITLQVQFRIRSKPIQWYSYALFSGTRLATQSTVCLWKADPRWV